MRSNSVLGTPGLPPARLFRWLSAILFVSAVAAMATLLVSDALNFLTPTAIHRYAGAWSFIFIGLSYVVLQFSLQRRFGEKLKAVLLGVAFLFWGSGEFLPPGLFATALDSAVVVIFVVDLSLIIVEHLKRNQYE